MEILFHVLKSRIMKTKNNKKHPNIGAFYIDHFFNILS